jgi:hypothetical protein
MVVRFKLDENIPGDAAALLRVAGHEVQSVIDEHLEVPRTRSFSTPVAMNRVY